MQFAPAAQQPPAVPPVESAEQVLQTIQAALNVDQAMRSQAEAMLRAWEADAVPGFLSSLMQIVEKAGVIDEVRSQTSKPEAFVTELHFQHIVN